MGRPAVFVIAAQKGGVGKTTTTVELAAALRRKGCDRVLVIDTDPQANATTRLGVHDAERTLNDVYQWVLTEQGTLAEAIHPSEWDGIDVVPSEQALKFREAEGGDLADFRMQLAIERAASTPGLDAYDAILIDTPPAGGPLLRNAMVAGDYVLVVTDPEPDGLGGAAQALKSAENIGQRQNRGLKTIGILVNRYDAAIGEHKRCVEDVVSAYPDLVWTPWIPERAAVKTARGFERSVETVKTAGGREYMKALDAHAEHVIAAVRGVARV